MKEQKHKMTIVRPLGEHRHKGRTYRVSIERVVDTGDDYVTVRLYNKEGKFIKRFAIEPEAAAQVAQLINYESASIDDALYEAEAKAWKALSKYKLWMFGYHSSQ